MGRDAQEAVFAPREAGDGAARAGGRARAHRGGEEETGGGEEEDAGGEIRAGTPACRSARPGVMGGGQHLVQRARDRVRQEHWGTYAVLLRRLVERAPGSVGVGREMGARHDASPRRVRCQRGERPPDRGAGGRGTTGDCRWCGGKSASGSEGGEEGFCCAS